MITYKYSLTIKVTFKEWIKIMRVVNNQAHFFYYFFAFLENFCKVSFFYSNTIGGYLCNMFLGKLRIYYILLNNPFHYIFNIRHYLYEAGLFPDRPVTMLRKIGFNMLYYTPGI